MASWLLELKWKALGLFAIVVTAYAGYNRFFVVVDENEECLIPGYWAWNFTLPDVLTSVVVTSRDKSLYLTVL